MKESGGAVCRQLLEDFLSLRWCCVANEITWVALRLVCVIVSWYTAIGYAGLVRIAPILTITSIWVLAIQGFGCGFSFVW